jgi:hypothetical protein
MATLTGPFFPKNILCMSCSPFSFGHHFATKKEHSMQYGTNCGQNHKK